MNSMQYAVDEGTEVLCRLTTQIHESLKKYREVSLKAGKTEEEICITILSYFRYGFNSGRGN